MAILKLVMPTDYEPHKFCTKCKTYKTYPMFAKNPSISDGYAVWCKVCHSGYSSEYNKRPHVRAATTKRSYAYQKTENGHRNWCAAQIVRFAIRMGILKREPCVVCGSTKVQAHHDDYTKPLDVRWFCKQHHVEADKQRRENERSQGAN